MASLCSGSLVTPSYFTYYICQHQKPNSGEEAKSARPLSCHLSQRSSAAKGFWLPPDFQTLPSVKETCFRGSSLPGGSQLVTEKLRHKKLPVLQSVRALQLQIRPRQAQGRCCWALSLFLCCSTSSLSGSLSSLSKFCLLALSYRYSFSLSFFPSF